MKPTREQERRQGTASPGSAEDRTRTTAEVERERQFRTLYRDASYYSSGRDWSDYAPAYRYGQAAYARHRGKRFEEVERILEQNWGAAKQRSRLVWVEARSAVRDAWRQAEHATVPHGHGTACDADDDDRDARDRRLHS